jgi:hypothetical protein
VTRICITGGPRTGKTTLARHLAETGEFRWDPKLSETQAYGMGLDRLRHTDDLIHLGWSEASQAASLWLDEPGPWIIEGVAVSRALRKWRDRHPGQRPPVDRVIFLTHPHESVGAGHVTMAKGVATVHDEIRDWLEQHGVRTEYMNTASPRAREGCTPEHQVQLLTDA